MKNSESIASQTLATKFALTNFLDLSLYYKSIFRYMSLINIPIFLIIFFCFHFSVFECQSIPYRNQCPTLRLSNGRIKLRSSGRVARVTCRSPFVLIRGEETMTCVRGEWSTELPICASMIISLECTLNLFFTK